MCERLLARQKDGGRKNEGQVKHAEGSGTRDELFIAGGCHPRKSIKSIEIINHNNQSLC